MSSKNQKKLPSSGLLKETTSAHSVIGSNVPDANKKRQLSLWPEFSDADISNEKWEIIHKGKVDRGTKAVPSAQQVQHFFDDPEGKLCELPTCLKVASWKRPKDFLQEKLPVIVDMHEGINNFDLMSTNEIVHHSELMRWITSQILALWHQSEIKKNPDGTYVLLVPTPFDPNNIQETMYTHLWRPWEHIYAMTKAGRGPNWPLYNPCGKYVVKLYWMGCWRKLIVDDTMPFDENDQLLLPSTTLNHELWPMLLTKALLKVAALDSGSGRTSTEFGDFSPIHCLRAWLPEIIPLEYEYMEKTWNLLKSTLPEFQLPDLPPTEEGKPSESGDPQKDPNAAAVQSGISGVTPVKDAKPEKEHEKLATVASEKVDAKIGGRESKAARSNKPTKKDKTEKEDKDKLKEKLVVIEEQPLPEHPEVMIFVAFHGLPKQPTKVTMLSEMADASERLRQHGLSHSYPHPVLLTETRSCPLVRPTPPPKSAAWKEVRYWKKKNPTVASAEPVEPVPEKPIKSIHLLSPFLNHNVTPLEIPADTHRPKSSLSRGSTQAGPGHMDVIAENEDPSNTTEANVGSAGKQQKKEPLKVVEETPKPPEAMIKPEKQESKSFRKSRIDPPKDLVPPEVAASPQSPKTDKRLASSKLSKRDTVRNADREKTSDSKMVLSSKSVVEDLPTPAATDQAAAAIAQDPGTKETSDAQNQATDLKSDLWMDFDVLYKCFKTLYIYHKPSTYPHNYPDVRSIKENIPNHHHKLTGASQSTSTSERTDKSKVEKKSQPSANTAIPGPMEDKSNMNFLFVDSLQPIEIVVSYSVISHWNDSSQYTQPKDELKAAVAGTGVPSSAAKPGKERSDRESKTGDASLSVSESSVTGDAGQTVQTVVGGSGVEAVPKDPVPPGLIYAETYSWKRVVAGETSLRLRTTGTRAALLTLPPGRHVLRFFMSSPLGHHHVHLCSTTNFIFGDEEKVMAELTKESCRFTDSALKGIVSLGRCLQNFSDHEKQGTAKNEFIVCNCLFRKDRSAGSLQEHHKAYQEALYTMLRTVLSTPESMQLLTQEMSFAWRVFNFDCTTKNPLNLSPNMTPSRPTTAVTNSDRGSSTGAAKKSAVKKTAQATNPSVEVVDPVANKVDYWKNREITADDQIAAVKVQTIWRGYFVRKVLNARQPGTEDNLKVQDQLVKAWAAIEPNMEQNALLLFRTMFRLCPSLMSKYSFYEDEWNRISYADYHGVYPEHGPNSWFLLFREVFIISEEMLCVPKLNSSTPYCMLRVINNDTGEEIPQVFLKVMPHVYKKNKAGYTFVAEAITNNEPMPAGRWRMRLIGSHSPLPAPPVRKDVTTSFNVHEMRDYYVPTGQNTIFRYAVKVSDDHLVTLQMSTSKPDVYIRLQILDYDEEVAGAEGKGGAVLPAFIFRKDGQSNSDGQLRSRSSSRSSTRLGAKSPSGTALQRVLSQKRLPSAGRSSRASRQSGLNSSAADLRDEASTKTHKYVIQAVVLRNGWPLSASQWAFVQSLKDNERNETIANESKERSTTPVRSEKSLVTTTAATPAAKGKSAPKGKVIKEKEKEKLAAAAANQFDAAKPHWLLRIVSDGNAADQIEVKKDTEHADAIKAMKKAWEEAEPGRAAKAKQSRLQYLSTHLIKVEYPDEGVIADALDDDSVLTTAPPQRKKPTEVIPPLDLTPWIRQTLDEPRDLEEVKEERELEWKREVEAFNARKKEMEEWRERDRQWRNRAKVEQLALFEKRQEERDEYRAKLQDARQAIRQQYLEIERQKMEELAAKEAALQAEKEKNTPSSTKTQKGAKEKKSPVPKKKK